MLEVIVYIFIKIDSELIDVCDFFEMVCEEKDEDIIVVIEVDVEILKKLVEDMEFCCMFSGFMDVNNCFIDI